MNTFVTALDKAIQQASYDRSITKTANGAKTYASSMNHNVDLFQRIGSARGIDLKHQFDKAYLENEDLAVRMLLWARDVRGGSGERQTVRDLLGYMESQTKFHDALEKIIPKIPEYGRWDDILIFKTDHFKKIAYSVYRDALLSGNGLAAKWAPREKSNSQEDRKIAKELIAFLGWTPKQYRKTLVEMTKVVESQMCAKNWSEIQFQQVPSVATRRYTKAFARNASDQYVEYLKNVLTGNAKINAGSIFPYDITSVATKRNVSPTEVLVAEAQWNALPNYMNGKRIVPVIDTSSSMSIIVPNSKHSHMHMAITIGMYVAEKNTGAFKNVFFTFDSTPTLNVIKGGDLVERYQNIRGSNWGGSTNLQKTFDLMLSHAIKYNVPNDEMPEIVIIPSDMQFDQADRNFQTNYQAIERKFRDAGYSIPKIVFWQMNGSHSGSPVRHDQPGVSLISGFSPAIMQAVLSDEDLPVVVDKPVVKDSPEETMLKALMIDRYDWN